jgi:hypothetical protein
MTVIGEFFAHGGGATVLPHDCSAIHCAGRTIPSDDGFALIGDSDSDRITNFVHYFIEGFDNRTPYFFRIVFNPTWFRKILREFTIRSNDFLSIDEHGSTAHTSRASINSHDVLRGFHGYRFLRLLERCWDGPVVVRLVGAGRERLGEAVELPEALDDLLLARGVRTGVWLRRSLSVLRWYPIFASAPPKMRYIGKDATRPAIDPAVTLSRRRITNTMDITIA